MLLPKYSIRSRQVLRKGALVRLSLVPSRISEPIYCPEDSDFGLLRGSGGPKTTLRKASGLGGASGFWEFTWESLYLRLKSNNPPE